MKLACIVSVDNTCALVCLRRLRLCLYVQEIVERVDKLEHELREERVQVICGRVFISTSLFLLGKQDPSR